MAKIGRNQPCPCGSGRKFKRCCGRLGGEPAASLPHFEVDARILERRRAEERIRQAQQGLGRPIVSAKVNEHQVVAVRNTVYFSRQWKTFPDFLSDYLKQVLEAEWGNAEIAKPLGERHPIMQWYDAYCRYQEAAIKKPGEVHSAPVTGIVACYLGLAYSLYLLHHNVELQARLVRRLKDPANFQGAYYELIVANTLIRAGFTLTVEDEADPASKHCEFAAVSSHTGKKYWVEAKMRSVAGLLGKTNMDGGSDQKRLSRLVPHLNKALAKPADDERLIFIDLNTEPVFGNDGKPGWLEPTIARLERYEARELEKGVTAYVFVTNMAFHCRLDDIPAIAAVPFGLGMPDFNRPGWVQLLEAYRQKQKHIDAYHIGAATSEYLSFPPTFDGSLPSEAFEGHSSRVVIGEKYYFERVGERGLVGTVTSATVNEQQRAAYIGVTSPDGRSQILRSPMSDAQLADYKAHPNAYFGKVVLPPIHTDDPYTFFEWLMEANKGLDRARLLEWLSKADDFAALNELNDIDLLAAYCERLVASIRMTGQQPAKSSAPSNGLSADPGANVP